MVLKRLKEYIDYKHISVSAFEKSIGMSNASFGKSLKNNGNIGSDKLENILIIYPDLSPEWLMTGNGHMLKENTLSVSNEANIIYRDNPDKDEIISLQRDKIQLLTEKLSDVKNELAHFKSGVTSVNLPTSQTPTTLRK